MRSHRHTRAARLVFHTVCRTYSKHVSAAGIKSYNASFGFMPMYHTKLW